MHQYVPTASQANIKGHKRPLLARCGHAITEESKQKSVAEVSNNVRCPFWWHAYADVYCLWYRNIQSARCAARVNGVAPGTGGTGHQGASCVRGAKRYYVIQRNSPMARSKLNRQHPIEHKSPRQANPHFGHPNTRAGGIGRSDMGGQSLSAWRKGSSVQAGRQRKESFLRIFLCAVSHG